MYDAATNPYTYNITEERMRKAFHYADVGRDGASWYDGTYEFFRQVFGQDARMFVKFLAATSPNNGVRQNLFFAVKALALWRQGCGSQVGPEAEAGCVGPGRPIRQFSKDIKRGFKGFMTGHFGNLRRAILGEDLAGPKVNAFDLAMAGDPNSVVIDRWMIRALDARLGFTSKCEVVLHDGGVLIGNAEKRDVTYVFTPSKEIPQDGLFNMMEGVDLDSEEQYVLFPELVKSIEFAERGLSDHAYDELALATLELARMYGLPPRDFQASCWVGIKIERDPVGLDNFVTFYTRYFGHRPPSEEFLQRVAESPKFTVTDIGQQYFQFSANPPGPGSVEDELASAAALLH